jgi:hypothetical protein
MGEKKNACRIWVGKEYGKRPLAGPRRRWEVHIKVDFNELG